ncbi:FecCD family ABC transporter permease [Gorillibacterium sp. sgz5001074]|uniref:FecCD family ABC transporter permease n=1 Tax=Gorillibacterium sp. sgz5001074 TaxID=3446695 RepID=UPI003F681D4E
MNPAFTKEKQGRFRPLLFLFGAAVSALLLGLIASLKWGAADVSWRVLYEAVTYQGSGKEHLYVQTLRLPRALTACLAGAQLALAGLLTQLLTRNPLASPHVFGINAGASLAVVACLALMPHMAPMGLVGAAFLGAAASSLLIWSMAGNGTGHAVRLALSGITVHFLFAALTEGLILLEQHSTDSILFWLAGSVSQAGWTEVRVLLPFSMLSGAALALLLPSFRLLLLEEEVAAGLGQRLLIVRGAGVVLVLLLSGSAVALCGPIGFVCLMVPHMARRLVGGRLGILAPFTALLGGALLVAADVASRWLSFPYESPVGIVTSALGAPFFIYLARRKGGAKA